MLFSNTLCFSENKNILVCFSAAVPNRESKAAPFFSGLKVAKELNVPIISISDPSLVLSNNLSLSWYAGNQHLKDLPDRIASLLDFVSSFLDANLVLFGGSGGGFATLSVISKMKSSKVRGVVWNPQTSISLFNEDKVSSYLDIAFLEDRYQMSLYERLESKGITHDLLSIYKDIEAEDSKILYMQNTGDSYHVRRHSKPFMDSLDLIKEGDFTYSSKSGIIFYLNYWGEGHIVPDHVVIISA